MKILFTGASSFTGYWFVKELIESGHEVYCTFTRAQTEYDGIRRVRVDELHELCQPLDLVTFGDSKFLEVIKENQWDLFCHHAAETTDFRSNDYDIGKSLENNTHKANKVLELLKDSGCEHILLTGSYYEKDEGGGTKPLEPFYLYGLSKHFTGEVFKYLAKVNKIVLGKFVIPNPFGPMEDPKLPTYLIKTWYNKEIPEIRTPEYIRDNIHISLLAKVYTEFAEKLLKSQKNLKINPSQYVETQGEFCKIFATEMEKRLDISCPLNFVDQKTFPEPKERYNTDKIDPQKFDWDSDKAWDDIANFYKKYYS